MGLREAIKDYQEPNGMVSIYKNPAPRSTDNGLLFTATYLVLLGGGTAVERQWYNQIALDCEIEPGLLARYPGEKEPTSHDDLTGASVASVLMARRIYARLLAFSGFYGTNFLERIPDFWPTLKACALEDIDWIDMLLFSAGILANCFEKRSATSGKCLAYLKCKAMEGQSRVLDIVIAIWRTVQKWRYRGGMKDVYAIYFGASHPFAVYGPEDFS